MACPQRDNRTAASARRLAEVGACALRECTSIQNEYSLLNRDLEREVAPVAGRYGVGVIPYFPLANGLLSGKYRRGRRPDSGRLSEQGKDRYLSDENFDVVEALGEFAQECGRSLIEVAIGGLAAQPAVASVIAGTTSAAQVRVNAAAGGWEQSPDELAAIDSITLAPSRAGSRHEPAER